MTRSRDEKIEERLRRLNDPQARQTAVTGGRILNDRSLESFPELRQKIEADRVRNDPNKQRLLTLLRALGE